MREEGFELEPPAGSKTPATTNPSDLT